jgi:capsular polysaccharide transport system permease protein
MSSMRYIPHEVGFFQAIRARGRVIGALILREIHTRFGRENLGYIWLFVEPSMLGLGVAAWKSISGGDSSMPGGMNKFSFFLIGYIVYYLFRTLVSRAANAVESNAQLFYHSKVTIEAVMLARSLLDTAAVMVCAAVFCILIGVFEGEWPADPLQMAAGIMMMFGLSHGTSLLVLAATGFGSQLVDRLVHPFTYLMLPFSGMFYMVWWMPGAFQDVLVWIPLVNIMEFTREGQFGLGVPYAYDVGYTLIWIICLNFLGLCALQAAKPHIEI